MEEHKIELDRELQDNIDFYISEPRAAFADIDATLMFDDHEMKYLKNKSEYVESNKTQLLSSPKELTIMKNIHSADSDEIEEVKYLLCEYNSDTEEFLNKYNLNPAHLFLIEGFLYQLNELKEKFEKENSEISSFEKNIISDTLKKEREKGQEKAKEITAQFVEKINEVRKTADGNMEKALKKLMEEIY